MTTLVTRFRFLVGILGCKIESYLPPIRVEDRDLILLPFKVVAGILFLETRLLYWDLNYGGS